MPRQYNSRGTPFKQNMRDLWDAVTFGSRRRGSERLDGRGWLDAVTHELLNVFVELVRAHPKVSIFVVAGVLFILGDRIWSGDWL